MLGLFPDRWLGTILYDSDLTQDSPEFRIRVPDHSNDGYQDPELWLRDLFHKLQSYVRDWWCAPPVEVIRTGTFLYFVDELRLVRHTNIQLSQVVNLDGRMFR